MSNDKGFFDTAEFRALLEKYEQMKEKGICSYFETHELSDIHSYYLYKEDIIMPFTNIIFANDDNVQSVTQNVEFNIFNSYYINWHISEYFTILMCFYFRNFNHNLFASAI